MSARAALDEAAAACRNAAGEMQEIIERLTRLRNELPYMRRWDMLAAETQIKRAIRACEIASDDLYREEDQR